MDRFNLGSHTRVVLTSSPEAQPWFNLGLNCCFAFNKSEGVKCFQKTLEFDPECVMAHWGIAHGCGHARGGMVAGLIGLGMRCLDHLDMFARHGMAVAGDDQPCEGAPQ
jgi:hypothetical protein